MKIVFTLIFILLCISWIDFITIAEDSGITVLINPERIYCGGKVTISGSTLANTQSKNNTVTIRFTPPGSAPFYKRTQLDGQMQYSFDLSPVLEAGQWEVLVTGPIKELGSQKGSFVVLTNGTISSDVILKAGQLCTKAGVFTENSRDITLDFPALPDKQEALDNMNDLFVDFEDFREILISASSELDKIRDVMDYLVYFPEVQEVMEEMDSELIQHRTSVESLMQDLEYTHEEMNNTREWCRLFHFQKQGWNFCIKILQAAYSPGATLAGYAKGKLKDAFKSAYNKTLDNFAIQNIGLTAEEIKRIRSAVDTGKKAVEHIEYLIEKKGKLTKIKVDGAAYVAGKLVDWIYDKVSGNCRMYLADFNGHLYIEYYTKGMVYMTAEYPINGELKLFFRKRESDTDIVRLKGQIHGKHGWRKGSFFPERTGMDIPGLTGIGFCIPQDPRLLGIYLHFNIPIEGEGKPNYLELEFKEPSYQIARLNYRYCSVLWSPYHIVPSVDLPRMDVPGAEWFFTRVTGTTGEKKTFSLPLIVDGDNVIVEETFKRIMEYVSESEFKAELALEIKGKEDSI